MPVVKSSINQQRLTLNDEKLFIIAATIKEKSGLLVTAVRRTFLMPQGIFSTYTE